MPQTILLLDDEPDNIVLMEKTLQRKLRDVSTVSFASPLEALAWCSGNEPDLCLVDYRMPEMSGIEFIVRARQNPRFDGIPMVMVTGVPPDDVRSAALVSGATEFLSKPINPPEMVVRCRNLLALRRSLSDQRQQAYRAGGELSEAVRGIALREQEVIIGRLVRFSEARDEETGSHMRRMAFLSQLIAQEIGEGREFCDLLLLAAPMHDIGKVGIPDRILLKAGRLDAAEWEIMKTHAVIGYDVLKDSDSGLLKMGAEIAHSHHEKFDGLGYPHGLCGESIPLVGRIVAVADVFDALVNERPYKNAWAPGDAFDLMRRERAKHFDPACVDAMLKRIGEVMDIENEFSEKSPSKDDLESSPLRREASRR
ncbi:MAG: response regulator [Acidiferrobacterales bacterium]